jgi:hypothetical protein
VLLRRNGDGICRGDLTAQIPFPILGLLAGPAAVAIWVLNRMLGYSSRFMAREAWETSLSQLGLPSGLAVARHALPTYFVISGLVMFLLFMARNA